ncbi:MAG TPA: hypothetical protein VIV60_15005 [Polyangiaceae bacterium]
MKYRVLLLAFCTCSCCCSKPPIDNGSSHCAVDLPFATQLSDGTPEGKETLGRLTRAAKYPDPNPANAEVWCNTQWNTNVVSVYCNHQVDDYCMKNCAAGAPNTECTQESARTKLTARCASESIDAFRKALPQCKALSICGLELKANCASK